MFPCVRAEFIDRRIGVCPDAAAVSTPELAEAVAAGATTADDDGETTCTCTFDTPGTCTPATFGTTGT